MTTMNKGSQWLPLFWVQKSPIGQTLSIEGGFEKSNMGREGLALDGLFLWAQADESLPHYQATKAA